MKSFKILFTLILALTALTVNAQYSESELQDLYMDMLEDEEIEGWIDSDGDVQFEYNERTFFIEVNENDPEFYRIVLFNIWPIESSAEHMQALQAVDAVNRDAKVAKAYTINDNVWIAVELFIDSPLEAKSIFRRCLDSIESAVEAFVEEM